MPDKDRSEIIKKMRQLNCLELKIARISGRIKTDKKDRLPCKITFSNEPYMELMAKAFIQLYFELLKKGSLIDKPLLDEEQKQLRNILS